jgi:hypothetical protein
MNFYNYKSGLMQQQIIKPLQAAFGDDTHWQTSV